MEDSFNVRVGKVFGSLASSSSSSSSSSSFSSFNSNSKSVPSSSLWSLTDDEIEKREWNRGKKSLQDEGDEEDEDGDGEGFFRKFPHNNKKNAINCVAELEQDLDDLDDEDAEEKEARVSCSKLAKPEDYNDEEWEIKSSIGRDCTLDYEEEEDAYDKVAVGRDKNEDCLYMKDINDYDVDADSGNVLPTTFKDFSRDPRANHIAAKLRLMEDEEAKKRLDEDADTAKKIDSLHVSDSDATLGVEAHISTSEDANLKSILKRKDADSNSRSQKRVRFDSECCKTDCSEGPERTKDVAGEACLTEEEDAMVSNEVSTLPQDYPSGIPDYMQNPSKYTRYTFDTSEVDDESNRSAYMDFLKLVRKSDGTEPQSDDAPVDLTKPVTFIPRRKTGDVIMGESCSESKQIREGTDKDPIPKRGLPSAMVAGDTDDEVCAMEEDEPETNIDNRNTSQRAGRQYRTKSCSE